MDTNLKLLELGCLYLDPYEYYSPDGKRVELRYSIEDFYGYNCICSAVDEITEVNFRLRPDRTQYRLGKAIIMLWRSRLIKEFKKVNRMIIEDNKTAIKIYDRKCDVTIYLGWYDNSLTVSTRSPRWNGYPWKSINLKQYK